MISYPCSFETLFTPIVGRYGQPHTSVVLHLKVVLLEWSGKEISVHMPHRGHS